MLYKRLLLSRYMPYFFFKLQYRISEIIFYYINFFYFWHIIHFVHIFLFLCQFFYIPIAYGNDETSRVKYINPVSTVFISSVIYSIENLSIRFQEWESLKGRIMKINKITKLIFIKLQVYSASSNIYSSVYCRKILFCTAYRLLHYF